MAAALLGILAEAAGFAPTFPEPGEHPAEAVERLRPTFVVLLGGLLEEARSDLFFHRMARNRVGLAVLLPDESTLPIAAWARERDVPCVSVPTDAEQFARVVDVASASEWWRSGRDRRNDHQALRGEDGSLMYVDRRGRMWRVLDRRGSDRRQSRIAERWFVGENGDCWRCEVCLTDHVSDSAHELERQLSRASRVPT